MPIIWKEMNAYDQKAAGGNTRRNRELVETCKDCIGKKEQEVLQQAKGGKWKKEESRPGKP